MFDRVLKRKPDHASEVANFIRSSKPHYLLGTSLSKRRQDLKIDGTFFLRQGGHASEVANFIRSSKPHYLLGTSLSKRRQDLKIDGTFFLRQGGVESNGTVFSTNWKEVGSKKVEEPSMMVFYALKTDTFI
ncbi:hypothetical protein CFP56_021323 [Quercus suber]|uniref:SGS domain-containing protein n=1 Tax=Quercus suber TaxID=58331 RepID=A0AAW0KEV4_QUESU